MTYYAQLTRRPLSVFEAPSDRVDVFRAAAEEAFFTNPSAAIMRMGELDAAQRGARISARGPERRAPDSPLLPAEVARERVAESGLDVQIPEEGIRERALAILLDRKRAEYERQRILANADQDIGTFGTQLSAGLLASLADPLNILAGFIPVVGPARYARMLEQAIGPVARAGVRARVGATEGAIGTALVEPLPLAAAEQDQTDYGLGDSLLNLAFGSIIGGGLHTVGGAVMDYRGRAFEEEGLSIPRADLLSERERLVETEMADIVSNIDNAMDQYSRLPETRGGWLLNTDEVREINPSYRGDRTLANAVHEPASWLTGQMYERLLRTDTPAGKVDEVLITSGGSGSGKTSALKLAPDAADEAKIVYDTTRARFEDIEAALESGHRVQVLHVVRDPVDAMVNGVLTRAMRTGRTVNIDAFASSHIRGARQIEAAMERYADHPDVNIDIIDNTLGAGKAEFGTIETVRKVDYDNLAERLRDAVDEQYALGNIDAKTYQGTVGEAGQGFPGGPQPGSARERVAQESGETREAALRTGVAQGVTGRDIDVEPVFDRTLPEEQPITQSPESARGDELVRSEPDDEMKALEKQIEDLLPEQEVRPPEGGEIVATARGRKIEVEFEIRELESLVTSDQAEFPAELQPRDRSREASRRQIDEIAQNLDPTRLGASPEADRGAPIVDETGIVESGNARVMALRKVFEGVPEKEAEYRQWLDGQGYETEGFQQPVLVRKRLTELDDAGKREFVVAANEAATAVFSGTEQALADQEILTPDLLSSYVAGDVMSAGNRDFARAFIGKLPTSRQGEFIGSGGELSAQGVSRIQSAILSKAYGGTSRSDSALRRMIEDPDDNAKAITGAMLDVAPEWAKLRSDIEAEKVAPEFDITEQLITALERISETRTAGRNINDALAQVDLFDASDELVNHFIRSFYAESSGRLGRAKGRGKIAGILGEYATSAREQRLDQISFLDGVLTPEQLLNMKRQGDIFGEDQADLLGKAFEDAAICMRAA